MEVNNPLFKFVFKSCDVGLMKNYSDDFYGPMRSNDTKNEFLCPMNLSVSIVGLLIVAFTNFHLDKEAEKERNQLCFIIKSSAVKEFLYITICFFVSLIFLPFTVLIAIFFKTYREYIKYHLTKDKSLKFKEFLKGEDTIWVCEDDRSKSIINVLAYVNSKSELNENLPKLLIQSIRKRILTKLILTNQFPKLFYRRKRDSSGYFYWTNENHLTIEDYVRMMDISDTNLMSEYQLKEKMSDICNYTLPFENSALWECLILKQAIKCANNSVKYAVIFRVHHSVGDGIALLRLFLEALSDKEENMKFEQNLIVSHVKDSFHGKFFRFIDTFYTIFKTPSVLYTQLRKEIDLNNIHPSKLSGNKVINWLYETDNSEKSLLTTIKLLKKKIPGSRFSNILLVSLSKSLKDYFEFKCYKIPKEMTVVIPARLHNMQNNVKLSMENNFSVALHTLPIDCKIDDRIKKIKHYSDMVVSSHDYQINYFMMSVVASIFPDWVLKMIMNSKHATMAISNLPGPSFTLKIDGFEFENVGFFLPNIDQTACGLTIMSYNQKIHLGMMADKNAIDSVEDLEIILNGMSRELYSMAKEDSF